MIETWTDPVGGVLARETRAGRFQVELHVGGAWLIADEPVEAGGLGSGPNPYELLSSALAACTTMTIRLYADHKGWSLEQVSVRVLHARNGLRGRDRFVREVTVVGDLDDEQRQSILEIADRCPVHLTLANGAEVLSVLTAKSGMPEPMRDDHTADMLESCAEQRASTQLSAPA